MLRKKKDALNTRMYGLAFGGSSGEDESEEAKGATAAVVGRQRRMKVTVSSLFISFDSRIFFCESTTALRRYVPRGCNSQ